MTSLRLQTVDGQCQMDIKVSSNQTLGQVLGEFCDKHKLDINTHGLFWKNKEQNIGMQMRLSGIPQNAKLEVKRLKEVPPSEVNIAVQIDSKRISKKVLSNTTLWDVLKLLEDDYNETLLYRHVDKEENDKRYMQPVLTYLSTSIETNKDLRKLTLQGIGIKSGSGMFRLTYKETDLPFDAFVEEDQKQFINENNEKKMHLDEIKSRETELMKKEQESKERNERIMKMEIEDEKKRKEEHNKREIQEKREHDLEKKKREEERRKRDNGDQSEDPSIKKDKKTEEETDLTELLLQNPLLKEVLIKGGSLDEDRNDLHSLIRQIDNVDYDAIPSEPLDRDTKVYKPKDDIIRIADIDLPDEFFEPVLEDIQIRKKKEEPIIMTNEYRKKQRLKDLSKYKRCIVRILLPDHYTLQGIFYPQEGTSHVEAFVREHLKDKSIGFYLYTTPPVMPLDQKKNLRDQNFLPATQVYFAFKNPSKVYPVPLLELEGVSYSEVNYEPQQKVYMPKKTEKEEKLEVKKEEEKRKETVKEANKEEKKKVPTWFMKGKQF